LSDSDPSEDRRHYKRLPFNTDAMLAKGDEREQVDLVDISLKGLLTTRPDSFRLEKGDEVRALVQLGEVGEDDPVIDLIAEVAHVGEEGVGATWREIDGESFTHLSRLLQLNFDDPDRLLRELDTLVQPD
jgi:hypothetical protein